MEKKRSVCPVACTLDLIGDKWTLLIIRDLVLGSKYFKDFLASPEGIATNILSNRLTRLTDAGIVDVSDSPDTVGRKIYALTEKGHSLKPILQNIVKWGLNNIEGTSVRLQTQ